MNTHSIVAQSYPDPLLDLVIRDIERRNLRDYSNHETRWLSERSSALRAERRARKTANRWNP